MEKISGADLLRAMIGFAAAQLMKKEVGAATRAAWASPLKTAQRNGETWYQMWSRSSRCITFEPSRPMGRNITLIQQ